MIDSRRPPWTASTLAGVLGLTACASLDSTADIHTAQAVVSARSDVWPDWGGPWSPGLVEWHQDRPLSVHDAARLALRNHPGLRASVESIAQARADLVQAHLLPNPVLNLQLGFPVDGGPGQPLMGALMQPIAALWQRPASIDSADANLRAVVLAVSDAALTLVADAEVAHARLVFAERDLVLEQSGHELATGVLTVVDERLAEGEAALLDRNRAALDVLEAETRVTDATVRRDRARRDLLEICGVADEESMPATDGTPVSIPAWIGALGEVDAIEMAEAQRLDLTATRLLTTGALDEVRLAELRRIGDVSLGVGYTRNFEDRAAVGPALGITLPIFDDGRAQVAKAESVARAAEAEAERVRQRAVAEVRTAWVRLQGALANLVRQRDAVLALAVENRGLGDESLEAGVIDRGTALALRLREVRARIAASAAELDAIERYVELERAAGGRLVPPAEAEAAR